MHWFRSSPIHAPQLPAAKGRLAACLVIFHGLSGISGLAADATNETKESASVELQGRLVCLPEAMHQRFGADLPSQHEHILGLETTNQTYVTLLRTKLSEALFVDPQLREKTLLLTGRIYPGTQIFDVTYLRSVREGEILDLYYWCDICSIKSIVPGRCMCCQEDVVLKERPVQERFQPPQDE